MQSAYKIKQGVRIGPHHTIGEYVLIGIPPRGKSEGELETLIGDNAVIRSHSVIYSGNKIGDNFETGHGIMIRESNIIGNNVRIGSGTNIEYKVTIGNNVNIHSQVFIPEFSIIEDDCFIGPNVVLTNARYPQSPGAKKSLKGPVIKKNAKIGANSTILPGVVIGENALVGAGSTVTKDVPSNEVVAGNPARTIKNISELPY